MVDGRGGPRRRVAGVLVEALVFTSGVVLLRLSCRLVD